VTTSYVSSAITSLLLRLPRSPFASAKLSRAPFNHYAKIVMWVRDILLTTRNFKRFDQGRSLDLKLFAFITLYRETPCKFFASCTANETSGGFFKVNERISSHAACEGHAARVWRTVFIWFLLLWSSLPKVSQSDLQANTRTPLVHKLTGCQWHRKLLNHSSCCGDRP
jgi:hypothetical protein